ncbi:Aldo/keto reductase [Lophiostoma macrostomum CBS 122681]|uniref:Aldo/keto reductase n=1 Tax=Lophiostoma macrostomum CBS 122681 TaxID=1314788 RepID=A0A6A6SZ62_9PLEO|nr:Aldo/keto reductase [Lophiostoma macrostomum CBS 122681]
MASKKPVRIILGTHTIGSTIDHPGIAHFDSTPSVTALLSAFASRGYTELDTAANYPGSEVRIGTAISSLSSPTSSSTPLTFTIHTKIFDGIGQSGSHTAPKIAASLQKSLKELQIESVDTLFLHCPDRQTRVEEYVGAVVGQVEGGRAKRWGVSNYSVEEVREILRVCTERGWRAPSVYQGHYNAIVRGGEKELFPLLREHGMEFWAYSPAAGGFFSEKKAAGQSERWKDTNPIGTLYQSLYSSPALQTSLSTIRTACASASSNSKSLTPHTAALRWTAYHSVLDGAFGDAVIFSVSSLEQLQSTLDALEQGPLPEELAQAFAGVFEVLGGTGPGFHL